MKFHSGISKRFLSVVLLDVINVFFGPGRKGRFIRGQMKDSDWLILSELYDTKNITKAANRLYITQPSLTKRLKQIEEEFSITVVNRTTKGVEFTPEGELLAEKSKEYLKFLGDLHREIHEMNELTRSVIMLGSSYTFSKYELSDLLMEFKKQHPNIDFEIRIETSNILYRNTADGYLDASFVRGDYKGDVERIDVGGYQAYLVTREPVSLEDVPGMSKLDYRTSDQTLILLEEWWRQHYHTDIPKGPTVGFLDVTWELIARSSDYYTLCFLPDEFRNPYGLSLQPLKMEDGKSLIRGTYFMYRENRSMSRAVREFIRFVKAWYADKDRR